MAMLESDDEYSEDVEFLDCLPQSRKGRKEKNQQRSELCVLGALAGDYSGIGRHASRKPNPRLIRLWQRGKDGDFACY